MIEHSQSDIALLRAAASLAAHAPRRMRATHLAPRLEELAERLESGLRADPPEQQLRAA